MDRLDVLLQVQNEGAIGYAEQASINNASTHQFKEGNFSAEFSNLDDCIHFFESEKIYDDVTSIIINFSAQEKEFYLRNISYAYDAYITFEGSKIKITWASKKDCIKFLKVFKSL